MLSPMELIANEVDANVLLRPLVWLALAAVDIVVRTKGRFGRFACGRCTRTRVTGAVGTATYLCAYVNDLDEFFSLSSSFLFFVCIFSPLTVARC